jgi:isoquinoline 1-oxidoreductase beta subunit
VESAICFGLGAALKHQVTWSDGAVVQRNFDTWPLPHIDEMPKVDVRCVDSSRPPSGLGEAATPGVAPALCNAVFAATGRRIRRLPFDLAMGPASA